MKQQIDSYLNSKNNAWSPNTLASERRRLLAVEGDLLLPPETFFSKNKDRYSPYALRTLFIRLAAFKEFHGDMTYKQFMKHNARLFKYVYQKKLVTLSFEEAKARLSQLRDVNVQLVAELMLTTGMRIHEALKYDGSGQVVGKGGKPRPIFSRIRVTEQLSAETVRRHLRTIGLAPHDLRKLAATRLAASGLKEADLMLVMGWSSISTASSYLQPMAQSALEQRVKEALT